MFDKPYLWETNPNIMYIMRCMDDPTFLLHNTGLIRPSLRVENGKQYLWYLTNRDHLFECVAERKKDNAIRVKALPGGIHGGHTFVIRPMTEEDLPVAKEKAGLRPEDPPHNLEECFRSYTRGLY